MEEGTAMRKLTPTREARLNARSAGILEARNSSRPRPTLGIQQRHINTINLNAARKLTKKTSAKRRGEEVQDEYCINSKLTRNRADPDSQLCTFIGGEGGRRAYCLSWR